MISWTEKGFRLFSVKLLQSLERDKPVSSCLRSTDSSEMFLQGPSPDVQEGKRTLASRLCTTANPTSLWNPSRQSGKAGH